MNKTKQKQARLRGERFINEYDLGIRKNFSTFFGPGKHSFSWLLPTFTAYGDGMRFPTISNTNIESS